MFPGHSYLDCIFLRQLDLDVVIGVAAWERASAQRLRLDLDIGLPSRIAARSDAVADTIDYARVIDRLEHLVTGREFHLVEALAEQVADVLLTEFHAPRVRVSVTKLGLFPHVGAVGVTIERER